ncbi:laccase-2 [Drosophila pseudoobscura]|uniref:Laccase-2 n=1 Tax=Drosophila pseudoobscura pseudoobscura TaxID=46245 RepID=A0A6I8UL52_DROPS|nr:laccase-2 [Drosophila pseudoobscura]
MSLSTAATEAAATTTATKSRFYSMRAANRVLTVLLVYALTVLLQFVSNASGLKTVNTTEGFQTVNASAGDTFCLYQEHNTTYRRELGAVWFASQDPCLVYSCAAGVAKDPQAHIVVTQVDCSEFYCEVGSELRKTDGSCCGECVRTHCQHNNTLYAVGESWHNDADCTLLECGRLDSGQIIVNTYQRTCPPLEEECPASRLELRNCCPFCRPLKSVRVEQLDEGDDTDDTWTAEWYRMHPCRRDCHAGAEPLTCRYTFVVEWYQTFSKACFDCPRNLTDCSRPHCVMGDGLERGITVVNRMMPGPAIEVCEGDQIVVDVKNSLLGESTSIHWHGLHQKDSPYMDGVPHITQCPITPHATFRYSFPADLSGTHFWHSHTGMQRGDGVFGALIIRKPKSAEPHGRLYDLDLSEHVMIVQDWIHEPGASIFASHHHSRGDNKPHNLLINGRGRYYNRIWAEAKKDHQLARGKMSTKPLNPLPKSEVDVIQTLPRSARLAKSNTTRLFPVPNPEKLSRQKRGNLNEIPLELVPHQVYNVQRGFRYRFRIINAEYLNCPIVVSVDKHNLTAINSDGFDIEALEVGSIVTYAGERFDFVLNANQEVGNYWVRLKGLMDCSEVFTSAFQVAILRYEGAPDEEPTAELSYAHKAEGIELNVMNRGPGYPDTKTVAEMRALPIYDQVPGIDHDTLEPEADFKFFVYYDFYAKNNPEFHDKDLYAMDMNMTQSNRLYTPQLNHITLKFPSLALLPSRKQLSDSDFCNETSLEEQGIDCRTEFCKCHHVLQVPLNAVVELIIVDEGFQYYANHPFHLHGNAFRVLALERLGENVTIEMIKSLDRFNLLKRNFVNPPVKDTVTIPDGGYTIIRFEAYNPGYWLFHCHIEFHAEIGMALVFKVGDDDQMVPVPDRFPTCGDYNPDLRSDGEGTTEGTSRPPTAAPQDTDGGVKGLAANSKMMALIFSLLLLKFGH